MYFQLTLKSVLWEHTIVGCDSDEDDVHVDLDDPSRPSSRKKLCTRSKNEAGTGQIKTKLEKLGFEERRMVKKSSGAEEESQSEERPDNRSPSLHHLFPQSSPNKGDQSSSGSVEYTDILFTLGNTTLHSREMKLGHDLLISDTHPRTRRKNGDAALDLVHLLYDFRDDSSENRGVLVGKMQRAILKRYTQIDLLANPLKISPGKHFVKQVGILKPAMKKALVGDGWNMSVRRRIGIGATSL